MLHGLAEILLINVSIFVALIFSATAFVMKNLKFFWAKCSSQVFKVLLWHGLVQIESTRSILDTFSLRLPLLRWCSSTGILLVENRIRAPPSLQQGVRGTSSLFGGERLFHEQGFLLSDPSKHQAFLLEKRLGLFGHIPDLGFPGALVVEDSHSLLLGWGFDDGAVVGSRLE
jgi:hypothetical protein